MASDVILADEARTEALDPVRGRDVPWVPLVGVGVIGFASGLSPLFHGFYAFTTWGVFALVMLALVGGLVLGGQSRLGRLPAAALIALVALAAIALVSVSWADSADDALTGASRWILYTSAFAILVLAVRRPEVARLGIAAVGAGTVVVAVYLLAKMIGGDGSSLFLRGRLNDPLGYINAQGLFPLFGVFPLIGLAQYARPLRAGLAAGGGTALLALAFLSQARSVALAFLVAGLAVLVLVPGRQRRAWLLLLMLGGVAAVSSPLVHVYDVGRAGNAGLDAAARTAAWWILVAAAGVGGIWAAVVAGARRFDGPWLRRTSAIALGAVALGGAGVLVARADRIHTYVRDQVRAFTTLQPNQGRGRLVSGGGNRYDFWRVAALEFVDHPVGGVGADNYDRDYYLRRRTIDEIRQPHSIELQTLAELGLLGALALAGFLLAVGMGAFRHLRTRPLRPSDGALLTAGIGVFGAWAVHASVDWSHLIPGATGIGLLAAAYLVTGPTAGEPSAARRRGGALAVQAVVVAGVVVSAIFVGRALLTVHYLDQGKRVLPTDPVAAIQKSNDALAFNPDSFDALVLRSAGFARLGDYGRSRAALLEASRAEPRNFVPWALLGDLAVRRGDIGLARGLYGHALRLNPRDPTLQYLRTHPEG